jgi:hypothetical protein
LSIGFLFIFFIISQVEPSIGKSERTVWIEPRTCGGGIRGKTGGRKKGITTIRNGCQGRFQELCTAKFTKSEIKKIVRRCRDLTARNTSRKKPSHVR